MAKGHTPRNFAQRYAKWSAKFTAFSNPTVANTILSNVLPIATSNFQANASSMANVNEIVSGILSQYGVTGPLRAIYQGFALKLQRMLNRIGNSPALGKMVAGLVNYYVSAFDANPTILTAIVEAITGSSTGYIS